MIAIYAAFGLLLGTSMIFMPGQAADPSAMGQFGAGALLMILLVYLLQFFLSIILINAVYRAMLRPSESSFAFMRIGGDEFRMLGLAVIFFIGIVILYLLMLLATMVVAFVIGAIAGQNTAVAGVLTFVLGIGFFALWIWVLVRLSLIFPMTFHRRRIAIDEGWALGKGRFWTLFGSYLVVWLLIVVLALVFFWSIFAAIFAAAGSGDPTAAQFAVAQMMGSVATVIMFVIGTFVLSLMAFVLGYGVVGSAARELLAETGDVPEADAYRTAEIFE
ncbi:hypothetical protein TPR58_00980 [Sphingomonas sp. HF-S3]|uniref:Glycerophosphoryl diester phosphodiesterase membrane domain-containing protein n=1 Tax=Sphingomonas rustica TaxID=3103142 RepID=A0ABV0B5B1_9SPHN